MRVDPLYSLGLTGALNDLSAREDTLTNELSSGVRVSSPSADPVAASESLRMGAAIERDDVFTQTASTLESRLQVGSTALGSVVTQITAAISLAVEGSNGTLSTANVQAIGQQIAGLRDEVVSLANTSYSGSYLFSGTSANTQPFTLNTTTSPATVSYAGDTQTQYTETPNGQKIAVSVAGSAVFSASGADVLGSLNNLVADFSTGTTSATTTADLNQLRNGLTQVSQQQGTLGVALSALQSTSTYAATDEANQEAAQTSLVSADTTQVATDLSANEVQQKALFSVMSSTSSTNLFDYLQQ